VHAVNVETGEHLDWLSDVSQPCCIERVPGSKPKRVLVSNVGNGRLQLVEGSARGKLKSLGKIKVGAARVAFVPITLTDDLTD